MNSTKSTNGRVNIIKQTPDISKLFDMYDKIPANQCATFRDPTAGIWNQNDLSNAFFSEQNIQILQNGIRSGVYQKSNGQYTVGPQDCDPLKIVMRSTFLQNSKNQLANIPQQTVALNQIVLDYAIKQVYSEAQSYMKYKRDASTIAVPLAHPIMSKTNDKQLVMKKWF